MDEWYDFIFEDLYIFFVVFEIFLEYFEGLFDFLIYLI